MHKKQKSFKTMSVCLLILTLLVTVNVAVKVPKNFRGSPEIFSGYLPNSDKFAESFTYSKGLEIVGNSTQVEKILAESNAQGKISCMRLILLITTFILFFV